MECHSFLLVTSTDFQLLCSLSSEYSIRNKRDSHLQSRYLREPLTLGAKPAEQGAINPCFTYFAMSYNYSSFTWKLHLLEHIIATLKLITKQVLPNWSLMCRARES